MVVARRHCIVLTCLGGAWLIRLQEKACRWCHDGRVPRHRRQRDAHKECLPEEDACI